MTTYSLGDRVRLTVDAAAGWPGAHSAPAGTLGTITDLPHQVGGPYGYVCGYGVLLDGDPYGLSASFTADEITAAE